jgi:SAM-dependent methyltransferase
MMSNSSNSDTKIIKDQLAVLSIAEGFFQSSILLSLLKLGVFERIGEESKSLSEIASELKSRPETVARLLNAGVVLKLLESEDGTTYRVGRSFRSTLLPSAGENYLGNWISNLDYFRAALSDLDQAILKSAPTVNPSHHLGEDRKQTREFTLAMHNYASLRGKELAHFLDTTDCKSLLDLGCGPGTYAFHLGLRNPELELYLLDLPEVLEVAKDVQARYSLVNKVHYLPRNATHDEIPGSYDMVLVSNTLHMLGEEASRRLLKRLFESITQGGSLVIQAQYLQDSRLGGRWPIFLDLIQLCITSTGKNHSVGETRSWLEEAGFSNIQYCSMSVYNTNSFLRGYKN